MSEQYIIAKKSELQSVADAVKTKLNISSLINWNSLKNNIITIVDQSGSITTPPAEQLIKHSNIPEYVKKEALRVANLVTAARNDNSIVFIAMSDSHNYGDQANSDEYLDNNGVQTTLGNHHAAMAAKTLAYALKVDFMAHLGDITWGSQKTTSSLLHSQGEELINMLHEAHGDVPCFHAIGNHDTGIYYHEAQHNAGATGIFTESGAYLAEKYTSLSESPDTIFGATTSGGYCYRDLYDKKLRIFLLNTSEGLVVNQSDSGTLATQRQWFADALLNLNTKEDAADWNFIVLSHYPADYGNTMPLSNLLKAYVAGSSITISGDGSTSKTYNFSGKNDARMIVQLHGHVHNFLTSKLYDSTQTQYNAWRMCVPNGQFNRENYYTTLNAYPNINFSQPNSYSKTANSAQETTFIVGVIDPVEKVIHSFTYGAGPEETVMSYGDIIYHKVVTSLTNATLSNTATSIEHNNPYNATISLGNHCAVTFIKVTMNGIDITTQCYSGNSITIPNVTGDVSITIKAEVALACTNWIPISTTSSGAIYNTTGYKNNVYIQNGADSTNSGTVATGFIPIKSGDVLRFYNMSFTSGQANHRIVFYNSSYGFIGHMSANGTYLMNTTLKGVKDGSNYVRFTLVTNHTSSLNAAYIRVCCAGINGNSVITLNEELKYADEVGAHTITKTYSNVTGNNSANTCSNGMGYIEGLQPVGTATITSVKVTMNGVDITSSVYNSSTKVINIPSVTGNVVIVATAEQPVTYTNQIPISTDTDGSVYNTNGFKSGYRLDSSGAPSPLSGCYITGFIPVKEGDTVYMYNVHNEKVASGSVSPSNQRLSYYDANKAYICQINGGQSTLQSRVYDGDILTQFKVNDYTAGGTTYDMANVAYFRIAAAYIGADSVITVNQTIE